MKGIRSILVYIVVSHSNRDLKTAIWRQHKSLHPFSESDCYTFYFQLDFLTSAAQRKMLFFKRWDIVRDSHRPLDAGPADILLIFHIRSKNVEAAIKNCLIFALLNKDSFFLPGQWCTAGLTTSSHQITNHVTFGYITVDAQTECNEKCVWWK